ncbi:hypothetical protein BX666DRAFT_1892166, partial [Dichotomocladium elegans]
MFTLAPFFPAFDTSAISMRYSHALSRPTSCSVSLASSVTARKSVWSRVSSLFSSAKRRSSAAATSPRASITSSRWRRSSNNSVLSGNGGSDTSNKYSASSHRCASLDHSSASSDSPPLFAIPPFSPTYCKANEFPYSNFYIKLPNGDYMVRYRSGNRVILGTEIIAGHM